MRWTWLFELEIWLWQRAEPILAGGSRRPGWNLARLTVSKLTRRLERRGRIR